jgi:hypothetical protein
MNLGRVGRFILVGLVKLALERPPPVPLIDFQHINKGEK